MNIHGFFALLLKWLTWHLKRCDAAGSDAFMVSPCVSGGEGRVGEGRANSLWQGPSLSM